ncbi:hypothetical protein GOODEAATRI_012052 [Goodea atripinnis]|uniref:Uncharacterized protein n=1 Tax=Goodea atripinnis TaxID=208336 RepID=A0ABV0NTU9_9TELE
MRGLWECVFCALVVSRNVGTSGELTEPEGHLLHADERNFTKQDFMEQEPFEQLQQARPDSTFNLRVQVNDLLSRQPLSHAAVELFVVHVLNSTAFSEEDGSALLHVPFHSELPITVVATKQGFMSAQLLCRTSRIPIFSSVTMSLMKLNQGNIWLFEDLVLITGRTAAAASQPTVRFPQRLLNLTHSRNITSIRSYLTVPKLSSEQDGSLNTLGIMSSKSGYVSVELSPVAAVSVQLFSGDMELQVNGPVQISLNVPESSFNTFIVLCFMVFGFAAGGWMRKGLGKMTLVDRKLMWTFTAPHLGYWIAAPLTSTRGRMKFSKNKARPTSAVVRRDQTTSTCHDQESETSSASRHTNRQNQLHNQCNGSFVTMKSSEVIANPSAVGVSLECKELDFIDVTSEQTRAPASLPDDLFFYNQPVAILPASAFFHMEEDPEQAEWSRSATLPRVGALNGTAVEPQKKESFTQTLHPEDPLQRCEGSPGPANTSRMPFSLPESASVPGTLNKLGGSRHSVHAITGLSKIPSPQPPRAWFVSLEGKPAAEIRYAVSEQQRRRRPMDSRETSLDSGVDLSELNQMTGRRPVTLERNATFIKSPSSNKHTPEQ